jgi:hypothetical protein
VRVRQTDAVEDLIAVAVKLDNGGERFFVTWGRIQDAVDAEPVEQLVLKNANGFNLGGAPVSARLCASLHEAADEPYFFEALFDFARRKPPGRRWKRWRSARAKAMGSGKELYYLGRP